MNIPYLQFNVPIEELNKKKTIYRRYNRIV